MDLWTMLNNKSSYLVLCFSLTWFNVSISFLSAIFKKCNFWLWLWRFYKRLYEANASTRRYTNTSRYKMHTHMHTQYIIIMILHFNIIEKHCPLLHLPGNSKTASTGSFVFLWNGVITEHSISGMFSDSLRAWAQIPLINHQQIQPLLD